MHCSTEKKHSSISDMGIFSSLVTFVRVMDSCFSLYTTHTRHMLHFIPPSHMRSLPDCAGISLLTQDRLQHIKMWLIADDNKDWDKVYDDMHINTLCTVDTCTGTLALCSYNSCTYCSKTDKVGATSDTNNTDIHLTLLDLRNRLVKLQVSG